MTPLASRSVACFVFRSSLSFRSIWTLLLLAAAGITIGCGSNSSSNNGVVTQPGNTKVTLLLSSTANDQLMSYEMYIQTLTLTNKSGNTVSLISDTQTAGTSPTQPNAEFMHLNGLIEPYGTVTVPQDTYTLATATIGAADFTCMTVQGAGDPTPGSLTTDTYAYGYVPNSAVTVNLSSPITVAGSAMGLKLNLEVSQSANFPNTCYTQAFPPPYAITPTFELSAMPTTAQPTNSGNGKVLGMVGEIKTLGTTGNQFVLYVSESSPRGLGVPINTVRTATIVANSDTVYHGISGFSDLLAGSFVDLDGAIQSDGSIAASRISVNDPSALNVMFGPVTLTNAATPDFLSFDLGEQGVNYDAQSMGEGIFSYTVNTVFQVTDQFTNLGTLPFVPTFAGANMIPGQNAAIYSRQQISYTAGPSQWTPATTMTLLPQVIDGTILGVNANGFQIQLAPYDSFPALAVQPGQTNLLSSSNVVEVYTDSNTAMLNTSPLSVGSTVRFYGLIFNNNGLLQMDCGEIEDGVDVTPVGPTNSTQPGDLPRVSFRVSAEGKRQSYSYMKYDKPATH